MAEGTALALASQAFTSDPFPRLADSCLPVQGGLELRGPFSYSKSSSTTPIPWHLLQTRGRGLGGPLAGLTILHPSNLVCPDLSKQAGSSHPQGYPGHPTPAVWHSAMVPGHLRPNVTLPLAVLVSKPGRRPPLSGPQPPQRDTGVTPPRAPLAGRRRGLEYAGSGTTPHCVSPSSCPSLLLPTTLGLNLC